MKHFSVLKKDKVDTIAIGSFDGIHLGHKQLINRLGENGALFVIDKDQANLTPGIKRSEYSKHPCMFYHFLKIKDLSGEEFIALLKKEFVNLKKIIVGYDFMFGNKRSCQASDLKNLFDGEVQIVEEYFHKGISVHSSVIRKLLQEGRVDEANSFLGREFAIEGEVISGQGLGKEELYPTLNLKVREYILPKDGVYATRTKIDKKIYNSVSFIGNRISTDGEFSIETHILDESILAPKHLEVFFVKRLRDNQKFDSLSELKKQINQDINEARESLRVCKPYALEFL
ncbi:MAG TPA: bifunctional riboflavin kinase/FMN adenylyltransferase [Sulfurospirillum sp. UBA12182]|nr:MAG TPA: bifunctional riboflavin kinase/FMN adenylyltransferase [Sulfurospirillum sp. UBA12182]